MNPQYPIQELKQMDISNLNQALRSTQTFVHTLLDSIHIGISQLNTQGQILSLNLEGARLLPENWEVHLDTQTLNSTTQRRNALGGIPMHPTHRSA